MVRNEDFRALGTLVQGLERMATLELRPPPMRPAATVTLISVLDELRVLIESDYRDSGIEIVWDVSDALPPAFADRYGLLQVFLNLARNSQRAMADSKRKRLTIRGSVEGGSIVIRFRDTGVGIAAAENLFRPFSSSADSSGLGLYVSRAVLRVFGGDLIYEPRTPGCCFAVVLPAAEDREEAASV